MRLVVAAIIVLAVYFAASLLWPAHDLSVASGPAQLRAAQRSHGPYERDLLARPAPRDADAYAEAATQLSALGLDEASTALAAWMESHVWRRLLGQPDAVPATIADAIEAGRGGEAALADLRAQVLAKSLQLDIDETADAATAPWSGRAAPGSAAPVAEAPGLWSRKRAAGGYEMHLALRATNAAGTPIGPFRLVVAWNGNDGQRLACEHRDAGAAAMAPGASVAVWCRDLGGDGRQLPVSNPAGWRGDGRAPNTLRAVAKDSTLDFPDLDVRIPGFDRSAFFLRDLRAASAQAQDAVRQLGCAQLGNCLRSPFKPQAMNAALLAWAVLMVVLVVLAFSYRRHRAFVLVLALFSCWIAMGRAMLAWRDAYFSSSVASAALWLLVGGVLAFLAGSMRGRGGEREAVVVAAGTKAAHAAPVGTATIVVRVILAIAAIALVFAAVAFGAILYGLSHWRG